MFLYGGRGDMVFNATFNNISAISIFVNLSQFLKRFLTSEDQQIFDFIRFGKKIISILLSIVKNAKFWITKKLFIIYNRLWSIPLYNNISPWFNWSHEIFNGIQWELMLLTKKKCIWKMFYFWTGYTI